jgi:hypothetical protein
VLRPAFVFLHRRKSLTAKSASRATTEILHGTRNDELLSGFNIQRIQTFSIDIAYQKCFARPIHHHADKQDLRSSSASSLKFMVRPRRRHCIVEDVQVRGGQRRRRRRQTQAWTKILRVLQEETREHAELTAFTSR